MRLAKTIDKNYGRICAFGKSYQYGLWTHIYVNLFDLPRTVVTIIKV